MRTIRQSVSGLTGQSVHEATPTSARERRRAAIRDAAIPLFVKNGFGETTMSAVAEAAGVSHGTIFLYFSSKDDLFRAAVLEPMGEVERALGVTVDPTRSATAQLLTVIPEHIAVIARREHYLRLLLYVQGQRDRFPGLARTLGDLAERVAAPMAELVALGQRRGELGAGPPHLVALSYLAYLQGLAVTLRKQAKDPIWVPMADHALRLFAPKARQRRT
jgi:AcrR family transcriptional regulator